MRIYKMFLIFMVLVWSFTGWAGAKDFVKKGDTLLAQRKDLSKAKAAIKEYQKALALDPTIVDAYWKIAQAYYWIGIHVKSKDQKMKLFKNGIEFGKMCVQASPKTAECHYWLGVAYGKYGEAKGILQSLYLVPFMKKELETVIKLKPALRMYGAYGVLGWVYFKVPESSLISKEKRGSKKKALELLSKAVKLGPGNLVSRYFYARVLLDKGDKAGAIKQLKFIIKAPMPADMAPEFEEEKAKAAKLLKEIEGK